ncbi:S-DNA-T family DNA segregation ATPase FtsK/SpoIIIE [Amycolatopsis sulphurea]|uniref:S-DNA-T family DNA segregation ATPase FtsK/SpoIIIE n=1 Tax=Amycolatopsis sulphurea TaxID=76022 RepID=A0A2A9FZU1_9PSEU|nr:FtsK/SpoIIIE domain-containing protein [Amycolatopsis sulphurea]PFG56944.1 S-DNA-T family DNA segregation ATPase FtsK/SpoIIIE [Amycolatopsis sulphurea]
MAPTDHDDEPTTPTGADLHESSRVQPGESTTESTTELATVHPLPVTSGPAIEGELVSEEEWRLLTSQRAQAAWRYQQYRENAVALARVTRTAVTHDRTKRAGKFLLRNSVAYPFAGAGVVAKRWRDMHGASRYERMMRQAERDGNHDRLLEWEARDVAEKQRRHERVMDWVRSPIVLAKAALLYSVGAVVLLLTLGFILWIAGKGSMLGPIEAIVDAIAFCIWFVMAYGAFLLVGGSVAMLAYLWNLGRTRPQSTGWFAPPEVVGEVVNLTPSIVVAALRDLGIRVLRDAIKSDADFGARMLSMITRYGPGSQVEITLPPQVTASQVMNLRETLAGNLDRKAHEVQFERSPDSERQVTLWVADSGALDRKLPDSPLLDPDFGPVDIYRDTMPWGVDVKGDPVGLNLLQQHLLLCGLSKQGKTAAARSLVLWLMLDPSSRLWLADLKGFGDWSMFEGLAEILIEGAGAENFIATSDMLEAAVAEMAARYERWRAMGRKGDIGREDSLPGSGFEPLFVVVDEVQKLFGCAVEHPDGGDIGGNGKKSRAARAAQALHDQARAVNVHFLEFSQNPTNANLPAIVREGAMIRASLYVGTESIARMALGEAAVDTGAAPHALRAGLDRGTVVLAPGESMDLPNGATHTTVRTHFISTEQAYDVAERATAFRQNVAQRAVVADERDLLDDLAAVFEIGEDQVKDTDLVSRLRKLAGPNYASYGKRFTGTRLRDLCSELEIEIKRRNGYWYVSSHSVFTVRGARDASE